MYVEEFGRLRFLYIGFFVSALKFCRLDRLIDIQKEERSRFRPLAKQRMLPRTLKLAVEDMI